MNTTDAAHAVAHDYPHGGTDALALRMGLSSGALLRNKVVLNRGPENRNHLTLAEAVRMTELADDDRILEAWARERGKALVQIPEAENCSDGAVLELVAESWQSHGEIGKAINETFADGIVERHEVKRIRDAIWTHLSKLFGLSNRIEGMVEK
ncbi:phage regulatory CII family protein [Paraburkholderia unamae]|uniref:Phage regulatory protein CII n=1 Tax=Paraburkholderia unamae TaxID=219649 RepID=A0ABX5KTA5_9BURK|nr:phage regulatory CII family protein [Paraburkholderia unamae]PVX84329.1 hypothetical protein C7402_105170 [Paraburkholderia unamae]